MGVVTSDILALTVAGLRTDFDAAYQQGTVNADWQIIASEIPTTLPIQNYGHLGRGALMREFIERLERQGVNPYTYALADKIYKGAMSIERKALEDDQYFLLAMRVRALGREPVRHWNQLAYEGLALGFTSLCYDGQYFFDTDHAESGSNQSNRGTSALSDAALEVAEKTMMDFVDDKGVPLEIKPDTLV